MKTKANSSRQQLDLGEGATLRFWRPLLGSGTDDLLATLCATLPWQQPEVTLFGRRHPVPRLQCWMGDRGANYRYSGLLLSPEPWHPLVADLRQRLAAITGKPFNAVLINLYRDGDDRMGWHQDDEPELGPAPWLASYNLGASRDFALRRVGSQRTGLTVPLDDDTLMLMSPPVQRDWQHALPVRKRVKMPRINMTFRHIVDVRG